MPIIIYFKVQFKITSSAQPHIIQDERTHHAHRNEEESAQRYVRDESVQSDNDQFTLVHVVDNDASTNRANDESTNRDNDESTNRANDESTNRANDESTNRDNDESTNRDNDESTNRDNDESTGRDNDESTGRDNVNDESTGRDNDESPGRADNGIFSQQENSLNNQHHDSMDAALPVIHQDPVVVDINNTAVESEISEGMYGHNVESNMTHVCKPPPGCCRDRVGV